MDDDDYDDIEEDEEAIVTASIVRIMRDIRNSCIIFAAKSKEKNGLEGSY
jgi:hypothetical protein